MQYMIMEPFYYISCDCQLRTTPDDADHFVHSCSGAPSFAVYALASVVLETARLSIDA
jgi:hypothetical protein